MSTFILQVHPLVLAFFVALLLCGILVIPTILYLKTNQRVGSYDNTGFIFSFKAILGLITNFVLPTFNLRTNNPPYLFNSESYHVQEYGFYMTLIILVAFVLLIKKGNRKEKHLLIGSELIILLCLFIKPINSLIHGLSVPTFRWSFVLSIYHVMVSAYLLEKYDYDQSCAKELGIANIIYVLLYVLYIWIYKIDLQEYAFSLAINIGSFALVYLYDLFLSKSLHKFFIGFAFLNAALFYVATLSDYGSFGKYHESYDNNTLQYQIYNDEDKLARYYFDSEQIWPYTWLNLNYSLVNDYCGVTTYDSTYQTILSDFLNLNGYTTWMIDIDEYELLNMLGVKYYVLSEDTDILDASDFEYVNNFDNFKVYKDKNYNHIAYTVSSFVTEENEQNVKWGKELIIKQEDYEKITDIVYQEKVQMDVIEYNRQYMKGSISVEDKTVLFVAIPYSEGWNVVDQNGNKLETINVNEGFLGIIIDESVSELSFYYGTPGLKAGIAMTFAGMICFVFVVVQDIKKNHELQV